LIARAPLRYTRYRRRDPVRAGAPTVLLVRPYTDADRQAWDGFVFATEGSHPTQLSDWMTLTEDSFGVVRRAWLAEEQGMLRGILPLFAKRRLGRPPVQFFSPPGGLLANDPEAAGALLAATRTALVPDEAGYIELRDQRVRWPELVTNTEHCTHELVLAESPEAQWRAFDAKLRNQIRKAERAGFTAHWGGEHLAAFCQVMLENMRDLGTPMRGERYFRRVLATLGDRAALLVIARAGEPVGAMFLAFHRETAFDLWASSLRRHFAYCPNQMLYWVAIQEVIRRGKRTFDFGRSQWDTGTYRFKEQWGARAVPLFYQYVLGATAAQPSFAAQQDRFSLATRVWKRLPLPVARLLGDPIRRRFPELL
jgi:FemAB-related protein (PEP-CTERM system-associated)